MMLADELKRQFGLSIPFFDGTVEEAQRVAQSSAKYLLLYLHSPLHESTEAYLHEVIGSDEIIALLSDNCILYGMSVADKKGHQLARELGAHAFPFVAALFRRKVILRLQGYHTREIFRHEWQLCTEDWDTCLAEEVSILAEREARERARAVEDAAAAEMEATDRAILAELQRKESEEATAALAQAEMERVAQATEALRVAEEARQAALEEERQVQKAAAKAEATDQLHAEPASDVPVSETVQISLRCPSGKHYDRCFLRSDPVDQLSLFVLTLDELLEATDASSVHLVTGFPPAPLTWETGVTTFGEMKSLCPRAVVLLRRS